MVSCVNSWPGVSCLNVFASHPWCILLPTCPRWDLVPVLFRAGSQGLVPYSLGRFWVRATANLFGTWIGCLRFPLTLNLILGWFPNQPTCSKLVQAQSETPETNRLLRERRQKLLWTAMSQTCFLPCWVSWTSGIPKLVL